MAKKSIIETAVTDTAITLHVGGAGTIVIEFSNLSDDIRHRAMVHGLVQKVSDAAAIPKADLPEDAAEAAKVKFAAMKAVATRLLEGDWSKRAEGGSGPVAGIILRAFTEFVLARATKAKKPITAEDVRAVYQAKTRAEQLSLRNDPEIAAIIERIKSERGDAASRSVDTESLLGELGL